jgi:hypothetical protein
MASAQQLVPAEGESPRSLTTAAGPPLAAGQPVMQSAERVIQDDVSRFSNCRRNMGMPSKNLIKTVALSTWNSKPDENRQSSF